LGSNFVQPVKDRLQRRQIAGQVDLAIETPDFF